MFGIVAALRFNGRQSSQRKEKYMEENITNTETKRNIRKRYATLLIDPPWNVNQRGRYGAINHYDLMSVEKIKAMPIKELATENSHCWLWVTNNTMKYGFDLLEAWGFTPRSIFTWIKLHMGLGNYLRNCTEHVLLGTRGKAPVLCKNQINYGIFPIQDHSHKPEEIHKIVERTSPGPYLELFARRRQPGWDVWGNEIDSDIIIPGYPVPKYSAKVLKEEV